MAELYGTYGQHGDRKPRRSLVGRLTDGVLTVFTVAVAVALSLTYVAPWISPASVWIFSILGLAAPATYLGAMLLALYWIVRWRWGRAGLLLVLLGVGLFQVTLFYKPEVRRIYAEALPRERGALKFLTCNVRNFYDDAGQSDAGPMLRFMMEQDADIVCLQEFNPELAASSGQYEAFRQTYGYAAGGNEVDPSTAPIVIFSKFRVIKWGLTRKTVPADGMHESIWADLSIEDDTVRVFNNHLHSTAIKASDNEFITRHQYLSDTAREDKIRSIVRRFRDNSILRAAQVDSIALVMAASPYARIVCGDFNDTPMSYVYRKMARGMTDAFRRSGRGYSHTFRGFFNTLRIDYVLVSREFEPLAYEVPDVVYSDHLPVVVLLRYTPRH